MEIKPIAYIKNAFPTKFGLPRQSGICKSIASTLVFEPEYRVPEALRGLEKYSHVWIIWGFSENSCKEFSPTVRPPRLGGNTRMGVFATRSSFRPNSLALSCVQLEKIEKTEKYGHVLHILGSDMLDGTPVYDVKPYLPSTDCHINATSGYAGQFTDYKLKVEISQQLKQKIPKDKVDALIDCLAEDPRPSYHGDNREYGMKFASLNVKFKVIDNTIKVLEIE